MKNAVLDAIAERRSIRSYTGENLSDEQLDTLTLAAQQAPSAVNRQPYHFTFVRDAGILNEFREEAGALLAANKPEMKGFDMLRGAPCVCFVFADPQNHWSQLDSGIAVENIALAAYSIGLGSVILGMPLDVFRATGSKWLKRLGCPEGYEFAIAIGIGVPAAGKDAHPIREGLVSVL